MQAHSLPPGGSVVQHDCATVQKTRAIIQMKSCDRYIPEHLDVQVAGLDIHIRRPGLFLANPGEDMAKVFFEGRAPVGTARNRARVKDGGIVVEPLPKLVPIQIVKGLNP